MLRAISMCCIHFVAGASWAAEVEALGRGFTKDGRFFVYEQVRRSSCDAPAGCHLRHAVALDVVTLQAQAFLLETVEWERVRSPVPAATPAVWETWLAAHPLAKSSDSPKGAVARLASADLDLVADPRGWQVTAVRKQEGSVLTVEIQVTGAQPARTTVAIEAAPGSQVRLFWSPDGKRVAGVLSATADGYCAGTDGETDFCRRLAVFVVGTRPPTVAVAADDALLFRWADPFFHKLDQLGLVLSSVTRAKTARARTTVYAHGDGLAAAQRVAAQLAGAAAEAATWPGKTDLTIAVGSDVVPVTESPSPRTYELVTVAHADKLEVLGWTEDARYFAYRTHAIGCCGHPAEDWEAVTVLDALTGDKQVYLSRLQMSSFDDLFAGTGAWVRRDLCQECRSRRELENWQAAHKLVLATGVKAPRGSAQVKLAASLGRLTWQKTRYAWKAPAKTEELCSEAKKIRLTVSKEGGAFDLPGVESAICDNQLGEALPISVAPYWSPDGQRLAWVVESSPQTFGFFAVHIAIAPAAGPRIELACHKDLPSDRVRAVQDALSLAGHTVIRAGEAKTARKTSVVYARAEQRQAAESVAALLGGAEVAPLDWRADADLVVAVGRR